MRFILLIGLLVSLATQCEKEKVSIPTCIQQKIDSIKQQPKANPPVEVHAWTYNGRKVYLFSAPCCDQYVTILDENCQYVCAPSGGITGTGDGKCTDFYQSAQHVGLIWKDDR
ncbi:MAG: hypothetical protein WCF67_01640 [Chitinophagaceae bacterium]